MVLSVSLPSCGAIADHRILVAAHHRCAPPVHLCIPPSPRSRVLSFPLLSDTSLLARCSATLPRASYTQVTPPRGPFPFLQEGGNRDEGNEKHRDAPGDLGRPRCVAGAIHAAHGMPHYLSLLCDCLLLVHHHCYRRLGPGSPATCREALGLHPRRRNQLCRDQSKRDAWTCCA